MNSDLLQKLMVAQTDEERSWIVTENLLESLPEDVASALWAVAIPHWFDAAILAALCPELVDRADEIYRQLQDLSCVEVFPERGHNVHELTRNQLLDRLWQDNPEQFRELSRKAASYFGQGNKPEIQIERIYHLVIAEPANGRSELFNLAQLWSNSYRKAEVESLILNLQQHITANRVTVAVKATIIFWDGKIKFRFYQAKEALERYEAALTFYREIGERVGEANALQEIGDVLQFLSRRTEALERYEAALAFYREIGARLGEANTLKAIGDVLQFLSRRTEALERYEAAMAIYREIGARLGEANTLKAIGDVLQFLKRSTEALERYEAAMAIYREIGARLGEANTLKAIGNVLQFLSRRTEALERYEAAMAIYREIGERVGEANALQAIGNVLQFLKRSTEALERYEAAMAIYREIGERVGEANALQAIGNVLQFLKRSTEALERYEAAMAIYREIGARLGEANTLQAIAVLEEDPVIGLASSQAALNLYIEIGTKYSQARNLNYFTSKIQLKLGQKDKAISSLTLAAKLAQEINCQPMVDYANQKIAEINRDSQGIRGWFNWIKTKLWKE
ncbi:tetratricopeptide repeat protein [Pseudanabaena yagii]|uniref:Tetratricopeptide repeat protein n=1 Tax=Pseudanabaena yagii GIHE-NHR1 TaxID=2722753 RepID=A0ABX1LRS1_9CYAN|nr:tetratricopeptide repeat protein [Pseudanabaena yagii]NMF58834.1 tetratricopeptide repeat protein [Pseudanabaena yagii GIHE-NHR1]